MTVTEDLKQVLNVIIFLIRVFGIWKGPFSPILVNAIGDPVMMNGVFSPVMTVYFVIFKVWVFKLWMLFPGIFPEEG